MSHRGREPSSPLTARHPTEDKSGNVHQSRDRHSYLTTSPYKREYNFICLIAARCAWCPIHPATSGLYSEPSFRVPEVKIYLGGRAWPAHSPRLPPNGHFLAPSIPLFLPPPSSALLFLLLLPLIVLLYLRFFCSLFNLPVHPPILSIITILTTIIRHGARSRVRPRQVSGWPRRVSVRHKPRPTQSLPLLWFCPIHSPGIPHTAESLLCILTQPVGGDSKEDTECTISGKWATIIEL